MSVHCKGEEQHDAADASAAAAAFRAAAAAVAAGVAGRFLVGRRLEIAGERRGAGIVVAMIPLGIVGGGFEAAVSTIAFVQRPFLRALREATARMKTLPTLLFDVYSARLLDGLARGKYHIALHHSRAVKLTFRPPPGAPLGYADQRTRWCAAWIAAKPGGPLRLLSLSSCAACHVSPPFLCHSHSQHRLVLRIATC
jgi:hypothetical protein